MAESGIKLLGGRVWLKKPGRGYHKDFEYRGAKFRLIRNDFTESLRVDSIDQTFHPTYILYLFLKYTWADEKAMELGAQAIWVRHKKWIEEIDRKQGFLQ